MTEKLSYQNANKQMKKLSEISWGISNDKWTEHKLEPKNGIISIRKKEISIQSQSVMGCHKFLIRHPGFWHNKIYELSCV